MLVEMIQEVSNDCHNLLEVGPLRGVLLPTLLHQMVASMCVCICAYVCVCVCVFGG